MRPEAFQTQPIPFQKNNPASPPLKLEDILPPLKVGGKESEEAKKAADELLHGLVPTVFDKPSYNIHKRVISQEGQQKPETHLNTGDGV